MCDEEHAFQTNIHHHVELLFCRLDEVSMDTVACMIDKKIKIVAMPLSLSTLFTCWAKAANNLLVETSN